METSLIFSTKINNQSKHNQRTFLSDCSSGNCVAAFTSTRIWPDCMWLSTFLAYKYEVSTCPNVTSNIFTDVYNLVLIKCSSLNVPPSLIRYHCVNIAVSGTSSCTDPASQTQEWLLCDFVRQQRKSHLP